jgi:hypothetical protein
MALPEILERVLRCRYCSREMAVSAGAYEENPFCDRCLPERIKRSAVERVRWRVVGDYFEPILPQES